LWVLELYARVGSFPSLEVADQLAEATKRNVAALREPFGALVDRWQVAGTRGSAEEVEGLQRLQRTRRLIDEGRGLRDTVADPGEPTEGLSELS
jgi:hypothetical protein